MGKASSSKKVARAARAGGRSAGNRQRNLLFPGAIIAIVLAGTGLIFYAANDRKTAADVPPVAFDDHWHAAFGVYVCDAFQPPIPEFEDPEGIHTHGDGVIHVHPFADSASGANARLGVFLDNAGVEVTDDSLKVGDETWTEGEDKCGDKDGEVVVAQWTDVQDEGANPSLVETDAGDLRFRADGEGYVVAFVPEGTDIPKPDTAPNLAELGAIDSGEAQTGTTATTGPEGSATTGTDTTATTTAGAGEGSTTTAGDTTTTGG
jgi:hypothetical protein